MSTKQFKMYLDEDFVERLESMAVKAGRRSAQQVAEEILSTYLPVWSTVNDAMNRAIRYQTEHSITTLALTGDIGEIQHEIGERKKLPVLKGKVK